MSRGLALVFTGGCAGGALRIGLTWAFPDGDGLPVVTILINIAGAAVLGLLVGRAERLGNPWWFPAVGPGLLGGFTTFSAMAVLPWITQMDNAPAQPWLAALVLAGTMVASVLCAGASGAWGTRSARGPRERRRARESPARGSQR